MIGGLHHVTCYSRSDIIQLSASIEPQYSTFIAAVPASGRSMLDEDLSDLNVEFKAYTTIERGGYREARVDFRFQNKTTADNIDGILFWINEAKGTLQWTHDGEQESINLTTNVSSVSESETMVLLRVPVDEVEGIHGSTSLYLEYRLETTRGINLRFDVHLLGKTSLLEPLSLTEIAKLNGNRDKTFIKNQRGNLQCSFFTSPTAIVDILKKDDKGGKRVLKPLEPTTMVLFTPLKSGKMLQTMSVDSTFAELLPGVVLLKTKSTLTLLERSRYSTQMSSKGTIL